MSEHHEHHHGGHHHEHHHEHHHGLLSRIKRKLKRKKWILPSVILLAVAAIGFGVWLMTDIAAQESQEITSGTPLNVGSGYRDITYQGKRYRYNSRITTILYAGVDSDEPLVQKKRFMVAPRADSISLVVLDEFHHKMTVIALSRDTMTKVRRYSMSGKKSGLYTDHLCYAYTYGDGGKASCDSLCEAVSNLLYGIPVNEYVVSNRASLPVLGEIIGPVQVTVPNDDLAEWDSSFVSGAKVTIDTSNLEKFVRSRDTAVDFSNTGRMERQQAYINGALERIRTLLSDNPNAVWRKVEAAEDCVQTNITRSRYLDLTRILNNTSYNGRDYYIPEGEQVAAQDYNEFYVDEDALLAKVIELFYIQK